jgi:hypothetical protein
MSKQTAKIVGAFDTKQDGTPNLTKNGNKYISVMYNIEDSAFYDSFFLMESCQWKLDLFFKALGVDTMPWDKVTKSVFEFYFGKELNCDAGIDKAGYKKIFKYLPAILKSESVVDDGNGKDTSVDLSAEPSFEDDFVEEEDDDDIPF